MPKRFCASAEDLRKLVPIKKMTPVIVSKGSDDPPRAIQRTHLQRSRKIPSGLDFNALGERLNAAFEGQDPVLKAAANRVYMGMLGGSMKREEDNQVAVPSTFATEFPTSWRELAIAFHNPARIAYLLRFELTNAGSGEGQKIAAEAAQLMHDTVQQLANEQIRQQASYR